MRTVYLVEDCENAPGRILATFSQLEDAELFAESLEEATTVCERTVFHGQPDCQGYNQ